MNLKKVLDPKYANKMAEGYDLRVELKKGPKGTSLYAKKPFKRGNVIAYYKFLVHKYTDTFKGKKRDMYVMSVYTKTDKFNPRVIGDIYEGSLVPPKYNIPFWAYFSNEPSGDQTENCTIHSNLKNNYRKRNTIKPGDTMIYKLVATRNIKAGEEIVWCYGGHYGRKYKANCGD
jgi:hypothetical protein